MKVGLGAWWGTKSRCSPYSGQSRWLWAKTRDRCEKCQYPYHWLLAATGPVPYRLIHIPIFMPKNLSAGRLEGWER